MIFLLHRPIVVLVTPRKVLSRGNAFAPLMRLTVYIPDTIIANERTDSSGKDNFHCVRFQVHIQFHNWNSCTKRKDQCNGKDKKKQKDKKSARFSRAWYYWRPTKVKLFTPKKVHPPILLVRNAYKLGIGNIIIFNLSKLWKAKF